jgi:RimJ/RimL family protein N-acetyltransferase
MTKPTITVFEFQPHLENEHVKLQPLKTGDFETLYKVASDPMIWEQHPNKDRYKKEVFENFFKGAIESKGAFLVFNASTDEVIGSSRYYDLNAEQNSIIIGYTFLARHCWGHTYNKSLKTLMLEHAFRFVDKVHFHIGAVNIRSQKAIEKLGAVKLKEEEVAYYGEQKNLNFIYQVNKESWKENFTQRS